MGRSGPHSRDEGDPAEAKPAEHHRRGPARPHRRPHWVPSETFPRTRDSLDALVANVRIAQSVLPVPLALEPIAALVAWPPQ